MEVRSKNSTFMVSNSENKTVRILQVLARRNSSLQKQ